MLKNYWYVACASPQLCEAPLPVEALGENIVLFRDGAGRPHALKDRCCHRGFPLSRGKVEGDLLSCGFHGWQFDGKGRCLKIPSQAPETKISRVYCVPSFACAEKDGYIWVFIGEKASGEPPEITDFAANNWHQGAATVACDAQRALEITFDAAHVYYVHNTHPATVAASKNGFAMGNCELRLTSSGCVAFAPPSSNSEAPIPLEAMQMEFMLPGRIRFFAPTPDGGAYHMNFFVTPLAAGRCRIDWMISNPDTDVPKLKFLAHSPFLQEDVEVLEAIQKTYEAEGDNFERSVEADSAVLFLRKIMRLAEAGEWPDRSGELPQRKVFALMGPAAIL